MRLALGVAVALLAIVPPSVAQTPSDTPVRIIVTLREAARLPFGAGMRADIIPELEQKGLRVRHRADRLGAVVGTARPSEIAALRANPNVLAVEEDVAVQMMSESFGALHSEFGNAQSTPWGVTKVQAGAMWSRGFRGQGVKVGIMDSGGDPTHPDLVWAGGYNAMTQSTSSTEWADNIGACNGHGTHVAGTIGARDNNIGVIGVAPEASLYALKVFEVINGNCSAWQSSQIVALDWAVAQGLHVVNISIGGSSNNFSYSAAVDRAMAAGTIVVAAAGNTGGTMTFPGAYPNAIGVGATTESDTRASFSAFGDALDVMAPGSGIASTMPGGGTGSKSGTSMASPHVAGVVALLRNAFPSASTIAIRDALYAGSLDIGEVGKDIYNGWGLVRAEVSYTVLGGGAAPTPTTLTATPTARSISTLASNNVLDSASLVFAGANASTTPWSATSSAAWLVAETPSGTGSGWLKYRVRGDLLPGGTSNGTVTVSAAGSAGPLTAQITIAATRLEVPLPVLGRSGGRQTLVQGTTGAADSTTLTITNGTSSTAWSAGTTGRSTILLGASGTGSGMLRWTHVAAASMLGRVIDTLVVSTAGGSVKYVDTLDVTAAPPQGQLAGSGGRIDVPTGSTPPDGSVGLSITGTGAANVAWSVSITGPNPQSAPITSSGVGSGTVRWTRGAVSVEGVAVHQVLVTFPGTAIASLTYADTIAGIQVGDPNAMLITTAGQRKVFRISMDTFATGGFDLVPATPGTTPNWTVTASAALGTVSPATGSGAGRIEYTTDLRVLGLGTHLATATVTTSNSSVSVTDTIVVLAPTPVAFTPSGRRIAVPEGTDSVVGETRLTFLGPDSLAIQWTAEPSDPNWVFSPRQGQGPITLRWVRRVDGLAPGSYVGKLQVVTNHGASGHFPDTLQITQSTTSMRLSSTGTKVQRYLGDRKSLAGSVELTQEGPARAWAASMSGTPTWSTLAQSSLTGTGSGTIVWNRDTRNLPVGTHVMTLTVNSGLANPASVTFRDTVEVIEKPKRGGGSDGGGKGRPTKVSSGSVASFTERYIVADVWRTSAGWNPSILRADLVVRHLPPWIGALRPDPTTPFGYIADFVPANIPSRGVGVDSVVFELDGTPGDVWRLVIMERAARISQIPSGPSLQGALRGGNQLSVSDREQLDALGNNNGRLDLGDLLAFLLHTQPFVPGPTATLRMEFAIPGPLPEEVRRELRGRP